LCCCHLPKSNHLYNGVKMQFGGFALLSFALRLFFADSFYSWFLLSWVIYCCGHGGHGGHAVGIFFCSIIRSFLCLFNVSSLEIFIHSCFVSLFDLT
jgi:hypothetical protein